MESSVLTRPDQATVGPANDGEPDVPAELTINQLAVHLQGEYTHDRLALMIDGVRADEIWPTIEKYHATLADIQKITIPKLRAQDVAEAAGKDPAAWQRPQRIIRVAPELQERLRRNLAVRKMAIGDPAAQSLVASVTSCFLDHVMDLAKRAQEPKPAPTPPPKTDFVARAEAIIAARSAAELVEQQQALEALQVRYLKVLTKFKNPTEVDVRELASLLTELSIEPERVRNDIGVLERAIGYQAAYSKLLRWLHKLNALRGNAAATDGELLASDDYEAREARTARTELTKLAKERPLFFDMKVSPPTLRYPPAPDEVSG